MSDALTHASPLWVWTSGSNAGSWHFMTITGDAGEAIAAHEAMRRLEFGKGRGFGSVKVRARIGETSWNTSVFPSKEMGGYLLPVNLAVRRAEDMTKGDMAEVALELL